MRIAGPFGLQFIGILAVSLALPAFTQQAADNVAAGRYPNASPYIDLPLPELIKSVPELKDLQVAADQERAAKILLKTGECVDEFFRHITDLTAREEISLTRLKQDYPSSSPRTSSLRVSDSYMILRHAAEGHNDIREYRTDAKGENFDQTVVEKGFMVTSGFALICNYFSTAFQPESRFRLLGEESIDGRDTYVVGFAQLPDRATLTIRMRERSGAPTQVLVQGVAWIDRSDYQIVRLRTDLLAPRADVGLNQQSTVVTLKEVKLADVDVPLWLPSTVNVFVEFTTHNGDAETFFELSYRNEHRYSDYQRYRVATKIVPQ